jgi:hypothetical protein
MHVSRHLLGEPMPQGGGCPVSNCSSGTWGTARASHWHARPVEHRSGGTWGTTRAAPQSFSRVGKNAHYRV